MSVSIVDFYPGSVSYLNNKNLRDMTLEFSLSVSMPVIYEGTEEPYKSFVTLTCLPIDKDVSPVDVYIPILTSALSAGSLGFVFSWTCDMFSLLREHPEYGFLSREQADTLLGDIQMIPTITLDGEDALGGSLNFTSSPGVAKYTSCYSIYRPLIFSRKNARIAGSDSAYKLTR